MKVALRRGWRGPQDREAGVESRKEAGTPAVEPGLPAACAGGPRREAGGEPLGPWLTAEQNERLAAHYTADRAPRPDSESAIDSRAGSRMIEIFAAMLPIEWG